MEIRVNKNKLKLFLKIKVTIYFLCVMYLAVLSTKSCATPGTVSSYNGSSTKSITHSATHSNTLSITHSAAHQGNTLSITDNVIQNNAINNTLGIAQNNTLCNTHSIADAPTTTSSCALCKTENNFQSSTASEDSAASEIMLKKGNLKIREYTDSKLVIEWVHNDGRILLTTFEKEHWGVWNIGGWYIESEGNTPRLIAGGGTDWEYVLCAGPAEDGTSFCGGNHGNETLVSINITDADSGTPIEQLSSEISSEGEPLMELHTIKIRENTILNYYETSTGFAKVERIYHISPGKITLDTRFHFIRDTVVNTSYVCMLPVEKDFSRYVYFHDTGTMYEMPPCGHSCSLPDCPNYMGMEATTSVEAMEAAADPIKLTVWIGNLEMVDNFKNDLKVFVWDLNQYCNKIYFSRFDQFEETLIPKGTVWNFSAGWSIEF